LFLLSVSFPAISIPRDTIRMRMSRMNPGSRTGRRNLEVIDRLPTTGGRVAKKTQLIGAKEKRLAANCCYEPFMHSVGAAGHRRAAMLNSVG
jgi:hypothetical protein